MFKLKHGIIARFNSCTVASNGPALSITLEFPDGVTGTSTRQKTLYASTEEDRAEWLESIDKCCAHSSINNRYLIDRANPLGKGPPPRPRPAIASALLPRRPSPPTPAMAPRLGGAAGVSGVVYKGVHRRDGSVWAIKEVLKINVKTSMSQKALQVNPPSHPPPTHTYHPPHPTSAPPSPPSSAAQPSSPAQPKPFSPG